MSESFGIIRRPPLIITDHGWSAPVPAGYSGPGDIVSGAAAWWGLRAYSAAAAGGNCVDILRASDSTTQTFTTLANGNLDTASIATFLASTTGKVSKLYDQTGNGRHLTQSTSANMPDFNLNDLGGIYPTMSFNGTSQILTAGPVSALSQPLSMMFVANSTSTGAQQEGFCLTSETRISYANAGANTAFAYAGTVLSATASDGSWHVIQAVFNNVGSPQGDCNVDGVSTTGNNGANNFDGTNINFGGRTLTASFKGKAVEAGYWPVAFSGTQGSMSTNAHRGF